MIAARYLSVTNEVSEAIMGQLDTESLHGLCYFTVAPVTEAEKSSPDIELEVKQGGSVSKDIPYDHDVPIRAERVSFKTEDGSQDFFDVNVAFHGWNRRSLRFTLALTVKEDAPVGQHFFRIAHQGDYDGKRLLKQRVVRVTVRPGSDATDVPHSDAIEGETTSKKPG